MFGNEINDLSPIHKMFAVFRSIFSKQQRASEQIDANSTNTKHSTKHQEEQTQPTQYIGVDLELLQLYKALDVAG